MSRFETGTSLIRIGVTTHATAKMAICSVETLHFYTEYLISCLKFEAFLDQK